MTMAGLVPANYYVYTGPVLLVHALLCLYWPVLLVHALLCLYWASTASTCSIMFILGQYC